MNPYAHALAVTGLVHQRVLSWAREVLLEAGCDAVAVVGHAPRGAIQSPTLALWAQRVVPWPKVVEAPNDVPLLGNLQERDALGVVPEAWMRASALLSRLLPSCYPLQPAKGSQAARPVALPALDDLPAPLRSWYEAQGEDDSTASWVVTRDGRKHGRLPGLSWRRGLGIRISYLGLAVDAAGGAGAHGAPFSVGAPVALQLGMQLQRVLVVQVPPRGADLRAAAFARAIGLSAGEAGAPLVEAADRLSGPQGLAVSLQPSPELSEDAMGHALRTLERDPGPTFHFAVQLTLGGAPELTPSATFAVPLAPG